MTKLLEKAFNEASKLSSAEQNILAKWLLEELKAERKWDKTLSESEDMLEQMAKDALQSHRKGKTTALDNDDL